MSPALSILLDSDMSSHALARILTNAGHDVLAAGFDPLLKQLDDRTLFAMAQSRSRIMVTHNSHDFGSILREWAESGHSHAGCIISFLPTNGYGEMESRFRLWLGEFPSMDDWIDRAVVL